MQQNYNELLENLKRRSNPENISNQKALFETRKFSGSELPYSNVTEYVKLAMIGVPQAYTLRSKEAANKVIEQLKKSHGNEVDFKFQGSIETNTHIMSENDIDLVQITNKSNSVDRVGLKKALNETHLYTSSEVKNLERHSKNFSQYEGNQLSDLGILRLKSEQVLSKAYKDVDCSKPKAICVNVKSPLRNVDVVTAVDYKSVDYMKKDADYRKGIQIYDKEKDAKLPVEYPFWSIKRINEKSILTNGRFKKLVRFLKNIKFDAKKITGRKPNLSSFDINAICYSIPTTIYDSCHYLELVPILSDHIDRLLRDVTFLNNLKSVDGQEYIFLGKPEKVNELRILKEAVETINLQIQIQKILAA